MGICRKVPKLQLTCLSLALLALWYLWSDHATPQEDASLRVLREESVRCLVRRGLDSAGVLGNNETFSTFICPSDESAYPANLCTAHHVFLNHSERRFVGRTTRLAAQRINKELSQFFWPIRVTPNLFPTCTDYYDEVFVFSIDISSSSSDDHYYHLITSTFIPLYSLLTLRRFLGPVAPPGYRAGLMPAIEDYPVKAVNWKSESFFSSKRFGMVQQLVEVFAGGMDIQPLDGSTLLNGGITCVRAAHFGVGVVNISDPALLQGFSSFIQSRLGLPRPIPIPPEPFVCLVQRSDNRRILNEEEVVGALSKFVKVQVVHLSALSYREQVAQMRQFTILIGFHGAELLNAIYMPPGAVTIQLIPYRAKSLPLKQYAQVLHSSGPFLEWENKNERLTRPNGVQDRDNNLADTVLPTEEMVDLVEEAMRIGVNARLVKITKS